MSRAAAARCDNLGCIRLGFPILFQKGLKEPARGWKTCHQLNALPENWKSLQYILITIKINVVASTITISLSVSVDTLDVDERVTVTSGDTRVLVLCGKIIAGIFSPSHQLVPCIRGYEK